MTDWLKIAASAKSSGRCNSTDRLEVHHKRRDGGNGIDNAEVLCHACHVNTSTYGVEGNTPPPFSEETKKEAFKNAGYKCECTRKNCHNHKN